MIIDFTSNMDIVLDKVEDPQTPKLKKPPLYKIVFINDAVTTYQAVIDLSVKFFNKSEDLAWDIAFEVDTTGSSIAGIYSKDVALTKLGQAKAHMQVLGYPFKMEVIEVPPSD